MRMMSVLFGVLASASLAHGEDVGRYAVEPSFDGFVRLDTETGSVAHCQKEAGVWRCENLIEETPGVAALRKDVEQLGDRVEVLDERLGALDEKLDDLVSKEADTPSETSFFAELQRRLLVLVGDIKRDKQAGS